MTRPRQTTSAPTAAMRRSRGLLPPPFEPEGVFVSLVRTRSASLFMWYARRIASDCADCAAMTSAEASGAGCTGRCAASAKESDALRAHSATRSFSVVAGFSTVSSKNPGKLAAVERPSRKRETTRVSVARSATAVCWRA